MSEVYLIHTALSEAGNLDGLTMDTEYPAGRSASIFGYANIIGYDLWAMPDEDRALAQRIAACWNAFDETHLSTDVITPGLVSKMIRALLLAGTDEGRRTAREVLKKLQIA